MATRKEGELVLGIALALTYCPRIKNDVLKCAVLQNEAAGRALLKAHEAIHARYGADTMAENTMTWYRHVLDANDQR